MNSAISNKCSPYVQSYNNKIIEFVYNKYNIKFSNVDVTYLFIVSLIKQYHVSKDKVLAIIYQIIVPQLYKGLINKYAVSCLRKQSVIGRINLIQFTSIQDFKYNTNYQQQQNLTFYLSKATDLASEVHFLQYIFQFQYQTHQMQTFYAGHRIITAFTQKITRFLMQMIEHNKNKRMDQLNSIGYINLDRINNYYNKNVQGKAQNIVIQLFIRLYETYALGDWPIRFKYDVYHVLHKLIRMKQQDFDQRFYLLNQDDIVENLSESIKKNQVMSIAQLKSRVLISKLMQNSHIDIIYGDNCYFDDIDDQTFLQLFHGVENKLQWVSSNSCFIVVKRLCDNMIYKRKICNHNTDKQQVEEFLSQFTDGGLYDVILKGFEYKQLQDINMRFLSYIGRGEPNLTLKYPASIVSLSLQWVQIVNLNDCINLTNLFTQWNHYTKENIQSLNNLRMFYSIQDTYENEEACMVNDLLLSNKLEYVYVNHGRKGNNIVKDLKMIKNIQNLRFFYHLSFQKTNVIIDLTDEMPTHLQVMYMCQQIDNQLLYNTIKIVGKAQKVEIIQSQLFNERVSK